MEVEPKIRDSPKKAQGREGKGTLGLLQVMLQPRKEVTSKCLTVKGSLRSTPE